MRDGPSREKLPPQTHGVFQLERSLPFFAIGTLLAAPTASSLHVKVRFFHVVMTLRDRMSNDLPLFCASSISHTPALFCTLPGWLRGGFSDTLFTTNFPQLQQPGNAAQAQFHLKSENRILGPLSDTGVSFLPAGCALGAIVQRPVSTLLLLIMDNQSIIVPGRVTVDRDRTAQQKDARQVLPVKP
jgi:hypothetical protein